MKKYLLFVLMAVITVGFSGCSSDDEEPDDTNKPPVTSTTGAITKDGVAFGTKGLECTEVIFTDLVVKSSVTRATDDDYETPTSMTFKFNDNVEVVIRSIADKRDESEFFRVYRLLKNCYYDKDDTIKRDISINFIEGGKIISSETFNAPNTDWWGSDWNDEIITFEFDFKGKEYNYVGVITYHCK